MTENLFYGKVSGKNVIYLASISSQPLITEYNSKVGTNVKQQTQTLVLQKQIKFNNTLNSKFSYVDFNSLKILLFFIHKSRKPMLLAPSDEIIDLKTKRISLAMKDRLSTSMFWVPFPSRWLLLNLPCPAISEVLPIQIKRCFNFSPFKNDPRLM